MVFITGKRKRLKKAAARHSLYVLNFLFALHLAVTTYYTSTFLIAQGVPSSSVGAVYALGSLAGVLTLVFATKLLKNWGYKTILIAFATTEMFLFFALATVQNIFVLAPVFIASFAAASLIIFSLDIFLEHNTAESTTGGVRAMFMTTANLAFVAAPVIGGFLLAGNRFSILYAFSAAIMLPFILLALLRLKNIKNSHSVEFKLVAMLRTLKRNPSIRNIFATHFLLRFFYATMVIYTPIYLHEHIGFSFPEIGLISAIMIVPFVLLEIPLGKLADKWCGEKELLIFGFAIMAAATAGLSLIYVPSFILWSALLFTTRIGAATIEIMSESYFFKHVDGGDGDDISAFRALRPLAYIIGPLVGTVILLTVSFSYFFLILGVIMSSGIYFASQIKDTR